MELEHFSHDHPLKLREDHRDYGEEVYCYGCVRSISGPSYACTDCLFFLHKLCAELPQEITHPSHPEHSLTLLPNQPVRYSGCICDICRERFNRFIYHCSQCNFDVGINCALMVLSVRQKIEHTCHEHQLTPVQKPSLFFCDACGTKHEGPSYLCTTCGFWANQECASLPTTIRLHSRHPHPLTLVHFIPYQQYKFSHSCRICDDRVYRRSWVYQCSDCSYFVHANCARSEAEHSTDYKTETKADVVVLHPNVITLPMPDESVVDDLITQFIKKISLQGKYKEVTEIISHVSHDHPLILCDNQIDDESSSSRSKLPLILNDEQCNGCAMNISGPFYHSCGQCNFRLHQWCAELPNEVRHPCHSQHPLRFMINPQSTGSRADICRCCGLLCNTFIFGCSDCEFYIDSKCASLPRIIRHEAHKHILALRQRQHYKCSACDDYIPLIAFVCDPCKLELCIWCVLLPRTVKHRYDKHPFTLTYSPVEEQPHEYYCEVCEEEIDSKYWFYHCVECDQDVHTKCLRPVDPISNLKLPVTGTIEECHPHLLTLALRNPSKDRDNNSACGICGESSQAEDFWAFECAPCNFWIHMYHVRWIR